MDDIQSSTKFPNLTHARNNVIIKKNVDYLSNGSQKLFSFKRIKNIMQKSKRKFVEK